MPAGEQPPGDGSAFDRMSHLPERGKEPASARVLDTWISQAQEGVLTNPKPAGQGRAAAKTSKLTTHVLPF